MVNSITFPGLKVDAVRFGDTDNGDRKCSIIAHEIGKNDCPTFLLISKGDMASYIEKAGTREGDYISVTGHVSQYFKNNMAKANIIIDNFFNMGNIDKKKENEVRVRQMARNTICFFDLNCIQQPDSSAVSFSRAANGSLTASFCAQEIQHPEPRKSLFISYKFQAFDEAASLLERLALSPGDRLTVKAQMQPYEKKAADGTTNYCVNYKLLDVGVIARANQQNDVKKAPIVFKRPATAPQIEDIFRSELGERKFG